MTQGPLVRMAAGHGLCCMCPFQLAKSKRPTLYEGTESYILVLRSDLVVCRILFW